MTARLSRKFYERFGDEIAGEFVDWFNAVDTTYQQQLREQNDLNWERFKAHGLKIALSKPPTEPLPSSVPCSPRRNASRP